MTKIVLDYATLSSVTKLLPTDLAKAVEKLIPLFEHKGMDAEVIRELFKTAVGSEDFTNLLFHCLGVYHLRGNNWNSIEDPKAGEAGAAKKDSVAYFKAWCKKANVHCPSGTGAARIKIKGRQLSLGRIAIAFPVQAAIVACHVATKDDKVPVGTWFRSPALGALFRSQEDQTLMKAWLTVRHKFSLQISGGKPVTKADTFKYANLGEVWPAELWQEVLTTCQLTDDAIRESINALAAEWDGPEPVVAAATYGV